MQRVLVANRGEIAVRIARAVRDSGSVAVGVYSSDDADSLHLHAADEALPLPKAGAAAYLDMDLIVAAARKGGCGAIHPGYGFLSESADFARACAAAGIVFVGPTPDQLDEFGDKTRARELARRCAVPLLPGTGKIDSLAEAKEFMASLGAGAIVMVKAVAGGGGRGMRLVRDAAELPAAFERCRSEAKAASGVEDVFIEQWLPRVRHIEVQIVGDGSEVVDLGERECTLQRRQQKLVEIAPSPTLPAALRQVLVDAALRMARAVGYRSLGTFEFLVDAEGGGATPFAFLEVNPRLQVEHTVTEAVTGIDLVQTQLAIANGAGLAELGLLDARARHCRGYAIQLRINAELPDANGSVRLASGRIVSLRLPAGPGVRVDTAAGTGYQPPPGYDSLLAKLIVHSPTPRYADAVRRASRALAEFEIAGIDSNLPFLAELIKRPEFVSNRVTTRFIEEHAAALFDAMRARLPRATARAVGEPAARDRGALCAPMAGRVIAIDVAVGDVVQRNQQVAILDAMKMEHTLLAGQAGVVVAILAKAGDIVGEHQLLVRIEPGDDEEVAQACAEARHPDHVRPDLQRVIDRHAFGLDVNRPDAVARRRAKGQRTARENVHDLCDQGSFVEYGALAIAAQRRRRPLDELIRETPADGLLTGIGTVNAAQHGAEAARCAVFAYDYTVLAGTQGLMNHKKTDRLLQVAEAWRLPVVFFTEGGGGRPGDTDSHVVAGLDIPTFATFARLSGKLPRVGIVSGNCFAGNAALLGCSDVIIATRNSSIGMSGPAMIEGGGLGVFRPEEIGPIEVQTKNGVVDVAVADEAEAVAIAKRYLAYFQGPIAEWQAADQRELRRLIPENRLRVYDVRSVIDTLFDAGSVLELRRDFGRGIVAALARVEGRALGVIANDPRYLSGAIDADAADKAARFMQLCDAFGLPIVSLCDTPGFMVGPEVEARAQVRHVSRMFVTAASLSVPLFTVVLRKGYGLGAMAMTGGSFRAPFFIVAWPSGEFGAMGLEGAVRLGYRRELDAIAEPAEREARFRDLVASQYANGEATNMASLLEIDAVIDPMQTRSWLLRGLLSLPAPRASRRFIDTW